MLKNAARLSALLLFAHAVSGCTALGVAAKGRSKTPDAKVKGLHFTEQKRLMATLYNYHAAEYRAIAYQAYNLAKLRIDQLRVQFPHKKHRAVVVDIDETVLDNAPHEAQSILCDKAYPAYWDSWMNAATAKAIPGSVSFLHYAKSNGFEIFYVSNRSDKYLNQTVENLKRQGFPNADTAHVLLRTARSPANPNPSSKESRRAYIEKSGYEIALLLGDNLGDFYEDAQTPADRRRLMEAHRSEFGKRFIALPNAMYGNWVQAIHADDDASVKALLHAMTSNWQADCSK